MKKLLFVCILTISLVSCQFQETMIINADGTGRMSLSMDLSEMMAFSGEMGGDSTFVKMDTIISLKSFLEEKKDSIAQLSEEEQARLKRLENYNMRMEADPEKNYMIVDIFTRFKNVSEANELMKGFEQTSNLIPGNENDSGTSQSSGPDIIGVNYSFENGVFSRDAFIKDEKLHASQMDSLKQAEAFLSSINYKIKYTFPKRIKSSSIEDATYSLNGRTIEFERKFIDYFKNPDTLDVIVELEQ